MEVGLTHVPGQISKPRDLLEYSNQDDRSMRSLCLLLISGLLWASCHSNSFAQTDGCGNYVPTEVDVHPEYDDVVYDFSTSMMKIRDLSDVAGDHTKNTLHSEAWPVGLSTGEMYFRVTIDIMKMRSGYSQMTCGQIKAAHVDFGFKDNKIYVAKEFPKRSCPYKEVLAHEEKHKTVDREIVEEYIDKIKLALMEASQKIGVVKSGSASVVEDQINSAFNQAVNKLGKDIEEVHAARQKEVDSKEEYQRVTDSCDGLTMETVQQRLEMLEATHPGITKVRQYR